MTGVKLELMTDPDMNIFIDSGLIGEVSAILHIYAKAKNPQCPDCDPKLPKSWIKYLDAYNLYGWSMIQYLPRRGFQWMDVSKI